MDIEQLMTILANRSNYGDLADAKIFKAVKDLQDSLTAAESETKNWKNYYSDLVESCDQLRAQLAEQTTPAESVQVSAEEYDRFKKLEKSFVTWYYGFHELGYKNIDEALERAPKVEQVSGRGEPYGYVNPNDAYSFKTHGYSQIESKLTDYSTLPVYLNVQPSPNKADVQKEEMFSLLDEIFKMYENGVECYEDPDDLSGYIGKAVELSDETFDRCVKILNEFKPLPPLKDE